MPNPFAAGQNRPFNPQTQTTKYGGFTTNPAINNPSVPRTQTTKSGGFTTHPASQNTSVASGPTWKQAISNIAANYAPKAATPAAPKQDWMSEIARKAQAFTPNEQALGSAMQSILPMYQARLGGLQGPTMDAMRLNAQQDIQSQYGNALRQAQQIAGNQGIRGPAAAAMQGDIRNQMGQAQAKYSRDLTVADWDAKRQALADYYGATGNMVGLSMGTPITMQQMQNSMTGMDAYNKALAGMRTDAEKRGGLQSIQQGFQANPMSSQFPLNPLAPSYYLPKMFS